MKAERSDTRKTRAPAMSSGTPRRPTARRLLRAKSGGSGTPLRSRAATTRGVSIMSGATELTRMPWGPHSIAMVRASAITPALAAP